MWFRFSLHADYTVPSASIPLSLLMFNVQVPAYPTKKQCCTIRHIAALVSITFARSVQLQSYPRLRTSTSSRFLLIRTLSALSIPFIRVFPVLFPRTQTGYECVFLFFSLSQFYGSRNPRAPVFVVCLCSCLLAQRRSGASTLMVILPSSFLQKVQTWEGICISVRLPLPKCESLTSVIDHAY